MKLTDSSIKMGQSVEITDFSGPDLLCERLHEMGFRVGMKLTVLGRAPFGGPLLIRFQTSFIALRTDEAVCALVRHLALAPGKE